MNLKKILIQAFVLLILAACSKQDAPKVSLLNSRYIHTSQSIPKGGSLSFKWQVEKGGSDLSSFTIRVNGSDLFGYPLEYIPADQYIDSTYFEGPINPGSYTYAFLATDEEGNLGEQAVVITVE